VKTYGTTVESEFPVTADLAAAAWADKIIPFEIKVFVSSSISLSDNNLGAAITAAKDCVLILSTILKATIY
jgi:hypothetical protein